VAEKLTQDRVDIASRFFQGKINEQQAMFLLITDGLSEEEAEIFLESMEYGVQITSEVILRICSWALIGMIGIAMLTTLVLMVS